MGMVDMDFWGKGKGGLGFSLYDFEMGTRLGHARTYLKLQISKTQFHSRQRL